MNKYYLWENATIYTNYGLTEIKAMYDSFKINKRFDYPVCITGALNNESYNAVPLDIVEVVVPTSKVIKITGRQNDAQAPHTGFYNPLHVFCKTNGSLVYAKDIKIKDRISALQSEVSIEYCETFDRVSSKWYILTTEPTSPNAFIDLYLAFPTDMVELEKYENDILKTKKNEEQISAVEEDAKLIEYCETSDGISSKWLLNYDSTKGV